jgi:hypothetical protein
LTIAARYILDATEEGDSLEKGEIDVDETADVLAAQLGSLKWTRDSRRLTATRRRRGYGDHHPSFRHHRDELQPCPSAAKA